MFQIRCALIGFLCVSGGVSAVTEGADLCAIVADPRPFIGRRVQLIATAQLTDEYMFLDGTSCKIAFRTGVHEWPKAIHVAFSSKEALETAKKLEGQVVRAGFQGTIRARKKYIAGKHQSGSTVGLGFGHLGMFAVEIVVDRIDVLP